MPSFLRQGIEIYYELRGRGEPLLLIAGLGASTRQWQTLSPLLEQHFQVIVFDNRGAGRSSAPDLPCTTAQMADDALGLLDHLSIGPATVIGWSMGGVIAQVLAALHPVRVRHLCLLHSFLAPDASARHALTNWVNMRRSSMTTEQVLRHMAWLVFSSAFAADEARYQAAVQAMVDNPHAQPVHAFVRQVDALLAHAPPAGLAQLRMPVSILSGQDDRFFPPHHARELHAAIPHSRLRSMPGAHVGAAEHPALYVGAMLELFQGPAQAH